MFVGVSLAGTTAAELSAIRDDVIHLCWKAYGGNENASKNCRKNSDIAKSTNLHATFKCWKSGWSGRGRLRCKYGAEAFDLSNLSSPQDNEVHPGAIESRRRRMISVDGEEEEEDVFSDGAEETEESKWENQRHPITFELENIEDEKVQSKCSVSQSADGLWQLSYTSAKCNVLCYPHGASRMFYVYCHAVVKNNTIYLKRVMSYVTSFIIYLLIGVPVISAKPLLCMRIVY